uniref:tetratricopeptide repeat-containing sulfotransferase family protein n=1 Tax=Novosphingobium sp. TaxID=1874826 RepID=UPI003D0CD78C
LLVSNDTGAARAALAVAEAKLTASGDTPADCATLWGMIGDAHALLNDFEMARAAYGRAIAGAPELALHHFNRAVIARYLGDPAAAAAGFEATVAREPFHAEAWLNLVQLVRQTPGATHVATIEALLARLPESVQTARARYQLHYAAAKCHEDLGEGMASFVHLDAGARLMRASLTYDVRGDLGMIDLLRRKFPQGQTPAPVRGFRGIRPIFVLGLPRSGSTVVERILTSHSQVGTVGESSAFARALADVARSAGVDPSDAGALILASRRLDPAAIGRRYAELTAPWRGPEACFVDKLPDNWRLVALIARALPDARIVHTTRDPMGTCYALYKTLFNQTCPWSYDLDELVAYYGAYRGLMAHWRGVTGVHMIEIAHETLVERPEPVIRQLLADCGLEWQPACLGFHENRRPSTTQSAAQVRAPLNRDGVDQWRRFAHLLGSLRSRIEALGPLP